MRRLLYDALAEFSTSDETRKRTQASENYLSMKIFTVLESYK
jgi:hypothetical protein